jgi:SAM-dependent methyltransferase
MNLEQYRASELEKARTQDLLGMLPKGRRTVLDIGARDGHFSRLLTDHFEEVTALDLKMPSFQIPRVIPAAGDVTRLQYADNSFDCVFCAEVLEHIPAVERACAEIARVARHEMIIGVPFDQDTRLGRTTCRSCGKQNPPWGHVNSFTEARLISLFPNTRVISKSFVGSYRSATNALAARLMDLAGNPWGAYGQEEPCIYCGSALIPPNGERPLWQKLCSFAAVRMNRIQSSLAKPRRNWIHLVFGK